MTDQTEGRTSDTRTHTFMAQVGDPRYTSGLEDVEVEIVCHNDPSDPHRDCKYTESDPEPECPHWREFSDLYDTWVDSGNGHKDMPERPRMPCGGFESVDGEHHHPDPGCGVVWTRDNVGDEAVAIDGRLTAGGGFTVWWEEGCPVLAPTTGNQPIADGGS